MATIRKRKGNYQVQIRRKELSPISKTFGRMKDAQEWARLYEIKADRQELAPNRKILDVLSLSDLIVRYRDKVLPDKKSKEIETIILNRFLKHSICKKKLSQISTNDFVRYRDERLQEIKPQSLKRQLAPISNAFVLAKTEWGIPLKTNPLIGLRLKVMESRRERRLRQGEYQKLLYAARTRKNPLIVKVIRFAVETGMRRGEILSLKWNEIDLERRSVTVLEAKNGYSRYIPLTPRAHALMQEIERTEGKVFPITANAIKMAWGRIIKIADIDDLHFHDLRHEAISRFFEMGLTMPEVASISGHRDLRMLMRYAHANYQRLERVTLEN